MKTTPEGPPTPALTPQQAPSKGRERSLQRTRCNKEQSEDHRAFFSTDKPHCQEQREGRTGFIPLPGVGSCQRQSPATASPGSKGARCPSHHSPHPQRHQNFPPQPTETPKLPPGPAGLGEKPLASAQLFAAAVLQFHCCNPTEFYSSSVTSYLLH